MPSNIDLSEWGSAGASLLARTEMLLDDGSRAYGVVPVYQIPAIIRIGGECLIDDCFLTEFNGGILLWGGRRKQGRRLNREANKILEGVAGARSQFVRAYGHAIIVRAAFEAPPLISSENVLALLEEYLEKCGVTLPEDGSDIALCDGVSASRIVGQIVGGDMVDGYMLDFEGFRPERVLRLSMEPTGHIRGEFLGGDFMWDYAADALTADEEFKLSVWLTDAIAKLAVERASGSTQ